jgi:aspartyl/glutamyl-tRNA(Asn/Gln) amidotransferase C subunit
MLAFVSGASLSVRLSRTAQRVCRADAPSRWRACSVKPEEPTITRAVVEKAVALAQLDMSSEEIDKLTPEFAKIVGFIDTLSALDVDGVEPMSRVEDSTNVLREDVPVAFNDV